MTVISLGSTERRMKVRSWPSIVLRSSTLPSPTPHSPIHHTPPPLFSYFPPQEFSPKHTAAVEGHGSADKPVRQGRQWCQSRVSLSGLSLPSSLQMRSCCSNYSRLDRREKKEPGIKDQILPTSGNSGPGLALQLSQNCSDNQNY